MASREENSSETDLATSDMEMTSTSTSTSTSEVDLESKSTSEEEEFEPFEALSDTDKERYFNFYCDECRTDKGLSAYVPSRVHDKDGPSMNGPAMEEEESRGRDKGVNIPVLFKCELPDGTHGTISQIVTLKSKKQLFWAFKLCGRILGRPAESLGFLHHGETWLTPFDTPEEMNMKPGDVVTIQPDLVYLSKSTGEKK